MLLQSISANNELLAAKLLSSARTFLPLRLALRNPGGLFDPSDVGCRPRPSVSLPLTAAATTSNLKSRFTTYVTSRCDFFKDESCMTYCMEYGLSIVYEGAIVVVLSCSTVSFYHVPFGTVHVPGVLALRLCQGTICTWYW